MRQLPTNPNLFSNLQKRKIWEWLYYYTPLDTTVGTIAIDTANGFAGSSDGLVPLQTLTLETTVNGIMQGDGTQASAVTIGTGIDYTSGTISADFEDMNLTGVVTSTGTDTGTNIHHPIFDETDATEPSFILSPSTVALTTPLSDAVEYVNSQLYITPDDTIGREWIPKCQYYRATSGTSITANADYYDSAGTTLTGVSLLSSSVYHIEMLQFFTKQTAGRVVWTLLYDNAPSSQQIHVEACASAGITAPPGASTDRISGDVTGNSSANYSWTTGTLTNAAGYYQKIIIDVTTGASTTSLNLQARGNLDAGGITVLGRNYWTSTLMPSTNLGTYT